MNDFEAQVLADLSVLKNQMGTLLGQPGRLSTLEDRVDAHEASLQRAKGFAGALGVLFTLIHLGLEWLRHN